MKNALQIISLVVSLTVSSVKVGANDVFILGNNYCITTGGSAIVFNKGNIKNYSQVSLVYPQPPSSDLTCNFENDYRCNDVWNYLLGWTKHNSLDMPEPEIITDHRWESFPIWTTTEAENYKLNYYDVLDIYENISIPLSIKIEQEAHIFLCDDVKSPATSNCYWIMLGSDSGTKSSIRKCPLGYIPEEPNVWPDEPCKTRLVTKYGNPFGKDVWNHFVIQKFQDSLKVYANSKLLLETTDPGWYKPKKMFIHSKSGSGLWKIHNYYFLQSTDVNSIQDLGSVIESNNRICISMFIKTASDSELIIRVTSRNQRKIVPAQTISTNDKWQYTKLIFEVDGSIRGYHVYISQKQKSSKPGYWAIDDVRECQQKEYRFIRADNDNLSCQKIDDMSTITVNENSTPISQGLNCSEDTFGLDCIPCGIFGYQYCPSFKYCQLNMGIPECFCSAGFKNNDCREECSEKYYGHGCSKKSHCKLLPQHINGYCPTGNCEEPYAGSTCDSVLSPFFKNPPTVTGIGSTEFTLQQNDLGRVGDGNYYYFQYSEKNQDQWTTVSDYIDISESEEVHVTNADGKVKVKSDTDYEVRSVIVRSKHPITPKSNDNYRKPFQFTTTCTQLTEEDVMITPTNISAQVTLKSVSCQLKKYSYIVDSSEAKSILTTTFKIPNLIPFREYSLTIRYHSSLNNDIHDIQKSFKTDEGVPTKVENLNFEPSTYSEVRLLWSEPIEQNGKIQNYEIIYKLVKRLACSKDENNEFITKTTTDTYYLLEDLKPYSNYEINVRARTTKFTGDNSQLFINTTSSDIRDNEKITVKSYKAFKNGVTFYLNPLPCTALSGPIIIYINVSCISEWCNGQSKSYLQNYNEYNLIKITSGLQPFTDYNATILISRNSSSNEEYSSSTNFQTTAGVPNKIAKIETYSKTSSSISLRWKPPYPPTGALNRYHVKYFTNTYYRRNHPYGSDFKPTECLLWNEFHCATIKYGVESGYEYFIQVSAQNKEVENFGPESDEYRVYVLEKGPENPYNLNYTWSKDNDLSISWYHPNNTNGLLTSFDIQFDGESDNIHIDEYLLIYATRVHKPFGTCKDVKWCIRAHNTYGPGQYGCTIMKTPPPLLPNNTQLSHKSSNTTIDLDLNISEYFNIQTVYLLISDYDKTDDLEDFQKSLSHNQIENLSTSRIVYKDRNVNTSVHFIIGNGENYKNSPNPPLEPGKNYSINVFLLNSCNGMAKVKRIQQYMATVQEPTTEAPFIAEDSSDGLWALTLLIVIPFVLFGVWYARKKNPQLNKIMRPQSKSPKDDQIGLTENTPINKAKVNVVKPKLSVTIPTLTTKHSKRIRIMEFENYVKEAVESGELEKQHNLFAKGLLKPHDVGSSVENKNKNRYKNLIAYDHTRVKLKRNSAEESDYINASYIEGHKKSKAYIATQGPKPNTLDDFWNMIWQTNVKNIIMLANIYENGKKKVDKYWPDINEDKQYGDIKVQYVSASVFANFDERTFNVYRNNEERKVTQLHFATWPDHGVPLYSQSLVPFLQKMLKISYNQSPILVHCSAGVGRTGTIILADICLRMAAGEGCIDFLAHLENLRNQRANLVDNIEQYKLAHLVVLECLFGMRTAIPCTDEMRTIVESTISNNGIKTQLKYIVETQWQDSAMETMLDNEEIAPIYDEKNRFKDIVPDNYRVYLTRYPFEDPSSSYINAVLVDDFRNPGRYIATQQPLPNTIGDFWRLVLERSCTVIVSLNPVDLNDETVCKIWPEKDEELNPVDFIKVIHKKTQRLEFYRIITVELLAEQSGVNSLIVSIVALDNWRYEDLLPNSIEEFLTFRDAVDPLSRTCETVILTCYDGARASGLYLALSFLIEKMKLEQECDVCLAVRSIRHSRKQFVISEEQYEFLYRASLNFITAFQPYSNFA